MANINRPSGFSPVKYQNGTPWNGQGNVYFLSHSNTDIIRIGDLVTANLTAAQIDPSHGLPGVKLAASGNLVYGAVLAVGTQYNGPYANPNNLSLTYAPSAKGTTDYYVLVADDPNIIFAIQEHSNGTALTGADIGANQTYQVIAGTNYISGWQLSSGTDATPAATATIDLKLLSLQQIYDANSGLYNTFGAYAKWLVRLNLSYFSTTTGFAVAT